MRVRQVLADAVGGDFVVPRGDEGDEEDPEGEEEEVEEAEQVGWGGEGSI